MIYARWHRSKGLPKKPRRRRQPQLFFLTPWRVRGPLRHAPRRPLQRAAGEAAVIIVGLDEFPAFVGLALDVGFSRLALGIKRIKVLFEAVSYGTIPELRHVAKVFLHS